MAESTGYDVVDISYWTNNQDPQSYLKRFLIINAIISNHTIVGNQSLQQLRTILESGWDVNEILSSWIKRTALHKAAEQGWTEGVKMLLDAGAKLKISGVLENTLTLALRKKNYPIDLIELLLRCRADANDHDDQFQNIPLLLEVENCRYNQHGTRVVELLLEHGANPNVIGERISGQKACPLSAALQHQFYVFTTLFRTLLQFGADVNYNVNGARPLLHEMLNQYTHTSNPHGFLKLHLDLFFLHGGNIHMEDGESGNILEYAVRERGYGNTVRWLIRHGADISPIKFNILRNQFMVHYCFLLETPLILLQAGMRVTHKTIIHLYKIRMAILARQENPAILVSPEVVAQSMWDQLEQAEHAEEEDPQKKQQNVKKSSFPEYWTRQMVDLQEFSNESLQLYPDHEVSMSSIAVTVKHVRDQTDRMLLFLIQTQSLQWYCRRCVRENLVSLQPSVVKTLPLPATLKRYIMCHEI